MSEASQLHPIPANRSLGQSTTPWQSLRQMVLQPNVLAIAISLGLHGAVAASLPLMGLNQDSEAERILDSTVVELTSDELAFFAPSATQEFGAGSGFNFEQELGSTTPPSLSNRATFPPPPPRNSTEHSRSSIEERWSTRDNTTSSPPPMSQRYNTYTYSVPEQSSQNEDDIWEQYQREWERIQGDRSYSTTPPPDRVSEPDPGLSEQELLDEKKIIASSEPSESEAERDQATRDGQDSGGMGEEYLAGVQLTTHFNDWLLAVFEGKPDLEEQLQRQTGQDPQVIEGVLPPQSAYQELVGRSVYVGVLVNPQGEVEQVSPLPANGDRVLQLALNYTFGEHQEFPESQQFQAYWFEVHFSPEARPIEAEKPVPETEPDQEAATEPETEIATPDSDPEKVWQYLLPLEMGEEAQERWAAWFHNIEAGLSLPEQPSLFIKRDLPASQLASPQRVAFAILVDESGNLRDLDPYPLQLTGDDQLDNYAQQALEDSVAQGELELPASGTVVADVVVVDLIPTEGSASAIDKSSPADNPSQAPEAPDAPLKK
ncbi:hypothetical protein [Sodalinema gerasimenkoae]|uniref:hypothetical protein n=1 Tax=Sodalinema gerasimenkoae TaxID=2862348 RepID=UPI00135BA352|nr:hypothetical protein [Sodalinema gerasimenkoae]